MIGDYAQLIQKIKNEYAVLYKENQDLKNQLQRVQDYNQLVDYNKMAEKNSQEIKEKENTNNYMKIAMKTAPMKKRKITSKEKLNPKKLKKQEDNIL